MYQRNIYADTASLDRIYNINIPINYRYVSKRYHDVLKGYLVASYARKGNPWDNACIESFHVLSKREWIQSYKIEYLNHAKSIVFEYIETFYNTTRIHGPCNYLTPTNYEFEMILAIEH